jgi:hypothetical protein
MVRFIFHPYLNPTILTSDRNFISLESAYSCNNYFSSKTPRAIGDWQPGNGFNATDPEGLMEFDKWTCSYIVVIRGLQPLKEYRWRVALENKTGIEADNLGCKGAYIPNEGYLGEKNALDCKYKTNDKGEFRLYIRMQFPKPRLDNDHVINKCANKPCNDICDLNPYNSKVVIVTGNWPVDLGSTEMDFDTSNDLRCIYSKTLTGLTPNIEYEWKVQIGGSYLDKYNCDGSVITNDQSCKVKPSSNGAVRFIFHPFFIPPLMTFDQDYSTSDTSSVTTPSTSTQPLLSTITKLCINKFSSNIVQAIGDWQIDADGRTNFNPSDPNGLMEFNKFTCSYSLIIRKLKEDFIYKWRVSIDNSAPNNYGCNGFPDGPDCIMKTNSNGEIRLLMKIFKFPYALESDYNLN